MTHDLKTSLDPAARTRRLGFSDIVRIRNRVLQMKQEGRNVIQLEGGEPFSPTPDFIKNAMKAALDADQTRYAPSSGIAPLLDAICEKLARRNGIGASPDSVIVVAGGMHGLFCAFQAILDPGDEVIFFSPYWTPIGDLVAYCEGNAVTIPWPEVRNADPAAAIRRVASNRTRVIYVNTPANPTGDVLTRAQLESIAAVARELDLMIIADEAYEDLVYDGEHVSIASMPAAASRTITVYTLSKSWSMTGWRVGYVSAPPDWMEILRRIVLNSVNGVSTPTQHAALAALTDRSDHLERMNEEYRRRRDMLKQGLENAGYTMVPPHGAFYLFVDVRERLGRDSWAAMNTLLERNGIATVPGVVFGAEGEGYLRMSFSNPIETLEAAIAALQKG